MTSKSAYSLREISRGDLKTVLTWRNTDRIRALSYNDRVISPDEHQKWFEGLKDSKEKICLIFEINKTPVGVIQLFEISEADRKCKWGFYLGEENLPKGVGSMMGTLALNYAFEKLPIDKIIGEAISHNEASIRFHQKLGFVQDGRIEKLVHRDGELRDVILFSLSRSDWTKKKKAAA